MEPWWAPYVITGVVSLIVGLTTTGVTLGLTGKREVKRRHEDQGRADKISQRQAVGKFLENSNKLATKSDTFKKETLAFERSISILNESQLEKITDPRMEYYEGMLAELEILDLYLHDKNMRKSFTQLSRICSLRYEEFLKLTAFPEYIAQYNIENQFPLVSDILDHGPNLEEIVTARNELLRAARLHLRLNTHGDDDFQGMFTNSTKIVAD